MILRSEEETTDFRSTRRATEELAVQEQTWHNRRRVNVVMKFLDRIKAVQDGLLCLVCLGYAALKEFLYPTRRPLSLSPSRAPPFPCVQAQLNLSSPTIYQF